MLYSVLNADTNWDEVKSYLKEKVICIAAIAENDVGYMVYVNGLNVDSVMDEEAVEIFWDYVDEYWYFELSTDDMLIEIFNSTADAIM